MCWKIFLRTILNLPPYFLKLEKAIVEMTNIILEIQQPSFSGRPEMLPHVSLQGLYIETEQSE